MNSSVHLFLLCQAVNRLRFIRLCVGILQVDIVFQEFLEYLVSPDSGNRDLKSSKLCVSNVKQILSVITSHKLDLLSLMQGFPTFLLLRTTYGIIL